MHKNGVGQGIPSLVQLEATHSCKTGGALLALQMKGQIDDRALKALVPPPIDES